MLWPALVGDTFLPSGCTGEMMDTYIIRLQRKSHGKRHTQFIEVRADDFADAEALMDEISLRGEVTGTAEEMEQSAKEAIARARPITDEELEWARRRAEDLGFIKPVKATLDSTVNFQPWSGEAIKWPKSAQRHR